MSRRRLTCLIQLDRSPFWPIGVHIGHVDTPRCSWVCAGMKTNPQDRSGGLSDRPGVPTERPSRHISISIDSSDTKGYYPSVLKWSSYTNITSDAICAHFAALSSVHLQCAAPGGTLRGTLRLRARSLRCSKVQRARRRPRRRIIASPPRRASRRSGHASWLLSCSPDAVSR